MTVNLVYELYAENNGELPVSTGNMVRATMLNLIRTIDEKLAKELHDSNEIKPFSVSPIFIKNGKLIFKNGKLLIEKGKQYKFRFSILGDLSDDLMQKLVSNNPESFKIGDISFYIDTIKLNMFMKKFKDFPVDSRIVVDMQFLTPTAFSMLGSDFNMPLPIPEYIIGNLSKIYSLFDEPIEDREDLIKWTKSNMYIMQMKNIRTKSYDIGKSVNLVGFTGFVKFCIHAGKYRNLLIRLLRYSMCSNLGIKRTAGMGVTNITKIDTL